MAQDWHKNKTGTKTQHYLTGHLERGAIHALHVCKRPRAVADVCARKHILQVVSGRSFHHTVHLQLYACIHTHVKHKFTSVSLRYHEIKTRHMTWI